MQCLLSLLFFSILSLVVRFGIFFICFRKLRDRSFTNDVIVTCDYTLSLSLPIMGWFHQRFTLSFYRRRSQKHKKDCQVISHFVLLGSAYSKAASKHADEIDPRSQLHQHVYKQLLTTHIPKAQKTGDLTVFLRFWDLRM